MNKTKWNKVKQTIENYGNLNNFFVKKNEYGFIGFGP